MMKRLLMLLLLSASCFGQAWSGVLAPGRAMGWSGAGATITNRTTQCGSTIAAYTGAATTINSAISGCTAGQFVQLGAGTFNISTTIAVTKSNVTLRGAGADQTFIVFTGTSTNCNGVGATAFCIWNGDSNSFQFGGGNIANWTAGFSAGTNVLTLSSTTNLASGKIMILSQNDDSSDPGNIWVCQTSGSNGDCSQQGGGGVAKSGASQTQNVVVTNIAGSNVTITPPIAFSNWTIAKSPTAWWSTTAPISGFGVENLSLDYSGIGVGENGIEFHNATNCWLKGIRSINATGTNNARHKHVNIYISNHITVRDSYFYGGSPTSEGYGVDSGPGSSDNLAENNIFQHMPTGTILETSCCNVFGYNYAVDNFYNNGAPNWQQQDGFHHGGGDYLNLWEGHEGIGFDGDDIHGTSWMITHFRVYLSGHDPATEVASKTQSTFAYFPFANSRYYNLVGSVLGTSGYHTTYTTTPSSSSDCGNGSTSSLSVFVLGYGDQAGTGFSNACLGVGFTINNDALVASTLMRWGNYDTVNAASRFVAGENASGAGTYPGLSSPSSTLPSSFYLAGRPSWWGSMPFPAVGPDVTGGNISNVGGHAYHNPAANCYLNIMGGLANGSSGALTFNAATCYAAGPPTVSIPTFSPVAGTYGSTQSVTISTSTGGATLCYTVDGSTPTANGAGTCTHGTTYSTAVSVSLSLTLKAVGSLSGDTDSAVGSAAYTITSAVATPTFSPVAGTYSSPQSVTISTSTGGATLCYTIDGTTPTGNGAGTCTHGTTYSVPVVVSSNITLKAIGSLNGSTDSSVGSAAYVIPAVTPTFSPVAGTYAGSQSVTISSVTSGVTICYTIDGTSPTANGSGTCTHGTTYVGTVSVGSNLTIKAIASKSGNTDSTVSSAAYSITYVVNATVVGGGMVTDNTAAISCPGTCSATYSSGASVTLTATPNAGNSFVGWSGTGGCTGTSTCVVGMTTNRNATATFAVIPAIHNGTVGTGARVSGGAVIR